MSDDSENIPPRSLGAALRKGAKKRPTGDYQVGYARPPEETKWQKGMPSPNPGAGPPIP
jgi:hypothetical protein